MRRFRFWSRDPEAAYGKSRPRLIGLQVRATLLIGVAALVAAQVTQSLYFNQMRGLSLQGQEDAAIRQARCIAEGMELALAGAGPPDWEAISQQFVDHAGVEFVALFRPDGKVVSVAGHVDNEDSLRWEQQRAGRQTILGVPRYERCHDGPAGHVLVEFPILAHAIGAAAIGHEELFGYVRIGTSTREESQRLNSAVSLTSGVGLGSMLLTVVLAFLVARQLVLPINDLTKTARKLAAGDLSARSSVTRPDEIGDLALAFNQMAAKLQRSHKAITGLNADLENRVRERTEHLTELAHHDPLTGLHNRRYFDEQLSARFEESQRYGTEFSCMMLDVDGFKGINDALGHPFGDEVLRLLGRAVMDSIRSSDLAARYGGDEFVILLPHTDAFSARTLGERIVERFAAGLAQQRPSKMATLSIGVATASESHVDSAEALVRSADQALYEAKRQGKNRLLLAHAIG